MHGGPPRALAVSADAGHRRLVRGHARARALDRGLSPSRPRARVPLGRAARRPSGHARWQRRVAKADRAKHGAGARSLNAPRRRCLRARTRSDRRGLPRARDRSRGPTPLPSMRRSPKTARRDTPRCRALCRSVPSGTTRAQVGGSNTPSMTCTTPLVTLMSGMTIDSPLTDGGVAMMATFGPRTVGTFPSARSVDRTGGSRARTW